MEEHEGVQIKNAAGGIVEIEFLVQLLQLKYGADRPGPNATETPRHTIASAPDVRTTDTGDVILSEAKNLGPSSPPNVILSEAKNLRTTNTLEALDALGGGGCLSKQTHDDLTASLVLLRRVENRLRLMHDRSLNELPADPDALNKLALRLGVTASADRTPGEALVDTLESYIHRSHRVFEELIRDICGT
ncbi:MAG: hypothetical protein HY801_13010 [Candidatus Lindowbacteria bacterium]|nr:hypothetical protein [Candidatus Lindowbacteria bacterium]